MGLQIIESSVLKIYKFPLLVGLADHYYLSETGNFSVNSLGWGTRGLEVQGTVKITTQEAERIEQFVQASRYHIEVNNCEHFANYVLYGINFSSQQNLWWKGLSAAVMSSLQPTQSIQKNYSDIIGKQVADWLNENLRNAKIERANQERIEFWKSRGIAVK